MKTLKKRIKVVSLLTTLCILLSTSASCSNKKNTQDSSMSNSSVSQTNDTSSQPVHEGNLNLLTGEYNLDDAAVGVRPLAVMINNIKRCLPQHGIGGADVYYETLAEGGITRILCVFSDFSKITKLGPVRSARDYYLDFMDPLGAIFLHWGGSPQAYEDIKARKYDDLDGLIYGSSCFWTDKKIAAEKGGVEHARFIDADGINKAIEKRGTTTAATVSTPAFNFLDDGKTATYTGKASQIKVPFSSGTIGTFDYNSEDKMYYKSEFGDKQIDNVTGKQINVRNVIVLFTSISKIQGDKKNRIKMDLSSGSGYYISDGQIKKIKWTKGAYTNPFSFFEEDSTTTLKINTGKTYVCVAPIENESSFTVTE